MPLAFWVSCGKEVTPLIRQQDELSPPDKPLQADSHREAQQNACFRLSTQPDDSSKRKKLVLNLWQALPTEWGFPLQFGFQVNLFPITQVWLGSWTAQSCS